MTGKRSAGEQKQVCLPSLCFQTVLTLGIMLAGGVSADLPSVFERAGRSKASSTAVRGAGAGWLGGEYMETAKGFRKRMLMRLK